MGLRKNRRERERSETGRSTTGLRPENPAECVVTHNLEVGGETGAAEWA
jgi:hypothetical protein